MIIILIILIILLILCIIKLCNLKLEEKKLGTISNDKLLKNIKKIYNLEWKINKGK